MSKWYNWLNEALSSVGIVLGIDIATTNDILGLVLIILNIVVLVVSMTIKIVAWVKKAKEDGQIDDKEMQELIDIVDETGNKIDDLKDKNKKDDKNA